MSPKSSISKSSKNQGPTRLSSTSTNLSSIKDYSLDHQINQVKAQSGALNFEAHKIDLLVPNSQPPTPLIKAYKSESRVPMFTPKALDSSATTGGKLSKKDIFSNSNIKTLTIERSSKIASQISPLKGKTHEKDAFTIKKDQLLHLIIDKKQKFGDIKSNFTKDIETKTSLLKTSEISTKREISLLNSRINKLFI